MNLDADKIYLDNWSIVNRTESPYQAPETGFTALCGEAIHHPNFPYRGVVTTSLLRKLDHKDGVAQTNNTKYHLLNPSDKWQKWLDEHGYTIQDFVDATNGKPVEKKPDNPFVEKKYFEIEYQEFETWVKERFGHPYDFGEFNDFPANSSSVKAIVGKPKFPSDEAALSAVQNWIDTGETHSEHYLTLRCLLTYAVDKGWAEPGNYLVNVCW